MCVMRRRPGHEERRKREMERGKGRGTWMGGKVLRESEIVCDLKAGGWRNGRGRKGGSENPQRMRKS